MVTIPNILAQAMRSLLFLGGLGVLSCCTTSQRPPQRPAHSPAAKTKQAASTPRHAAKVPPTLEPPIIVLDPGHGGDVLGARHKSGVLEKSVALSVALHARRMLEVAGIDTTLTRENDQNPSLRDRVTLANDRRATLFISIHANSSPQPHMRGCEVFILAPEGTSSQASEVEAREEAAELQVTSDDDETAIDGMLADLTQAAAQEDSARLALHIENHLCLLDELAPARGLRQARFAVLRAAQMPAALIELGYLTHGEQGRALGRPSVQEAAGAAIAEAVQQYLQERRHRAASR